MTAGNGSMRFVILRLRGGFYALRAYCGQKFSIGVRSEGQTKQGNE